MGKSSGFEDSLNLLRCDIWRNNVIEIKTMGESFHNELLAGRPQFFPTLAKLREYRNIAEHQIFSINLGSRTVLVADDQSRTAYVFKSPVLDPQFIRVIGVD